MKFGHHLKVARNGAFCALASILVTACNNPPPVVSVPPAEWTQPVPEPAVPEEVNDATVADYIVSLMDALRMSNNKLKRLDEWRAKVGVRR